MAIHSFLNRLRADCRGVGFIELAMVAPVLMLLCLGMIDISRLVAAQVDLEQAAQRTTDFALARRPTGSANAYLVAEGAKAGAVPQENVAVDLFLECNGVRRDDFNAPCPDGEVQARFASVAISRAVETEFNWTSMARLFGREISGEAINLTGDSVVRFQ